jgi:steroid delta-isomerase-like uncharacterized protein
MSTQTGASPGSSSDALSLARAYLDALAAPDQDRRLAPLLGPGFVFRGTHIPEPMGRDDYVAFCAAFREAFPDWAYELPRMTAEGGRVVVDAHLTGTHRGPLMGIPATGRRISVRETYVIEVAGGQVTSHDLYAEGRSLFQAIGVVP